MSLITQLRKPKQGDTVLGPISQVSDSRSHGLLARRWRETHQHTLQWLNLYQKPAHLLLALHSRSLSEIQLGPTIGASRCYLISLHRPCEATFPLERMFSQRHSASKVRPPHVLPWHLLGGKGKAIRAQPPFLPDVGPAPSQLPSQQEGPKSAPTSLFLSITPLLAICLIRTVLIYLRACGPVFLNI